jgi:nucleoside-diphosphate-sugar epimerase
MSGQHTGNMPAIAASPARRPGSGKGPRPTRFSATDGQRSAVRGAIQKEWTMILPPVLFRDQWVGWLVWRAPRHDERTRSVHVRMINMFVLVTGGTGFVGSHAVAALTEAGHRVRILARSPDSVTAALAPLGVTGVETSTGDVTDAVAVERALEGCEAAVHAASVFSLDPRRADEMRAVNVRGTEIVLGTASQLGLDPIVHVSSELALLPPAKGQVLTPDSPVTQPPWPYSRSKADSELVARRYQSSGAPVVSVMPAAVWGPHDPHFGEGATLAINVLKRRFPVVPPGGMHIADVRDVAAVLVAVMEPGRGPRRYMFCGHYTSMPSLVRMLSDLGGRRLPFVTLPSWFLAAFGRTADLVQRRLRTRLPWTGEGIWVLNCDARCDDSRTRTEFAIEARPLGETFADTMRWLVDVGHLSSREYRPGHGTTNADTNRSERAQ